MTSQRIQQRIKLKHTFSQINDQKNRNKSQTARSKVVFNKKQLQKYMNQHHIQKQDQSQIQIMPIKRLNIYPKPQQKLNIKNNNTNIDKKYQYTYRPKKKQLHLSKALINHLYRQNIKNYNPYISTLSLLEEQDNLKQMQSQMIRNLCYIGIAKNYIKSKKYSAAPNYTPVNVLIRTYMRDKMCKQIIDKQQNNQNVIHIPINQLALSFNPFKFPNNLQDVLSKALYTNIINQVNKIISYQYIEYKKINSYENQEPLLGKIFLGIIVILGLLFAFNQRKQLLFIMFGFGLIWIAYIVYIGKINLQKMVQSKNVTKTIQSRLIQYFEKIKTYRMQWKVGQDFYWLQIHYIKKKKKDFKI